MRYVPVERSPAGREALRAAGLDPRASLEEVAPIAAGCLLANELLDNLPFHWIRATERGVAEIRVGLDGKKGLAFLEGDLSKPELVELAPDLGPGEQAIVSPAAMAFLEQVARTLQRGYVWIADYGFLSGEQAEEPHSYLSQRLSADVLADPGSRDITAGVDFDALVRAAHRLRWTAWGPVTQREALLHLGFRELAEDARARQVDAIGARRGIDALRTYSDRTRANLLLAQGGLGDFLVLCLGIGTGRPPRSVR
jgi:SAM-dependent MidA family methyltransferase